MAVNHKSNLTNIYISDQSGIYYGLVIDRIKTTDDHDWSSSQWDVQFKKLPGVPGTYMATQLSKDRIPKPITKISRNKGLTWHLLGAPKKNWLGHIIDCVFPACSLHLQLSVQAIRPFYSSIRPFYSSTSSPGLIIGYGNWGSYLGQHSPSIVI